ncbi:hypothetical protein OWR29_26650 [Actinoplanes sp. Pm04-4]|uniref:Uncharacterized protein n=1 Tax=Paractinoplanes pyxinae TaxID=2997416 RepID=A0ABT4B512_9ACTN|nr:hypothetical protein [Actinoplanes pyxinae]MCY1141593.1 hypothetical protein [Actinoplanes pyxinae]
MNPKSEQRIDDPTTSADRGYGRAGGARSDASGGTARGFLAGLVCDLAPDHRVDAPARHPCSTRSAATIVTSTRSTTIGAFAVNTKIERIVHHPAGTFGNDVELD